jgi:hypothetical protein
MRNIHNEILKYLYENDSDKFIDLYVSYLFKETTKERIDKAVEDLKKYIEKENINESNPKVMLKNSTSAAVKSLYKLNVRITQQGRERYEKIMNEEKTHKLSNKSVLITLLGIILATLSTLFGPQVLDSIRTRKQNIPSIIIHINNKTDKDIQISRLQDFYLWFPGSARHLIGKYSISNEGNSDILTIPPGTTVRECRVINNKYFYKYLETGEYDLSLFIKKITGELNISDGSIPFATKSLEKYYVSINID